MKRIRLQILQYSYWEHHKAAKDMSLILPIDHPKRKEIEAEMNRLVDEIRELKEDVDREEGNIQPG